MSIRLTSASRQARLIRVATDFLEAFGRAVRQLRHERGMTQAELAARLSLGRTSITNLEKGRQSPPLSMLPEIAGALGVDPLHLIAIAAHGDGDGAAGTLAARVHDKDLRRWAGQIIGDTQANRSPDMQGQQAPRRQSP